MDAGFMTSGPFASFKWNLPNFFKYKDSSKSFTSQNFIYWNSEFHLRFTPQGDGNGHNVIRFYYFSPDRIDLKWIKLYLLGLPYIPKDNKDFACPLMILNTGFVD